MLFSQTQKINNVFCTVGKTRKMIFSASPELRKRGGSFVSSPKFCWQKNSFLYISQTKRAWALICWEKEIKNPNKKDEISAVFPNSKNK